MLNLSCLLSWLFSWNCSIQRLVMSWTVRRRLFLISQVWQVAMKTLITFHSLKKRKKKTLWKALNAPPRLRRKHLSVGNLVSSPESFPPRFCTYWTEISITPHLDFLSYSSNTLLCFSEQPCTSLPFCEILEFIILLDINLALKRTQSQGLAQSP